MPHNPALDKYSPGDRVSITDKQDRVSNGTVKRVNQKTVSVDTDDGKKWRIDPVFITGHVPGSGAAPVARLNLPSRSAHTLPAAPGAGEPDYRFGIGEGVKFKTKQGKMLRGRVERINQKNIAVRIEDGRRWGVSPVFLKRLSPEETAELKMQRVERPSDRFSVGERVKYRSKRGELVLGTVHKLNPETVGVTTDAGRRWRIRPRILEHLKEPEGTQQAGAQARRGAGEEMAISSADVARIASADLENFGL